MQSSTSGAAAIAAQQILTSSEIEQASLHLQQTQNGVIGAIKRLSEAQWAFKPAPDRWSIAEIVEHVIFVQERVLGPLRDQLLCAPAGPADRRVDGIVINQFPNRLTKFQAPEFALPKGGLKLYEGLDRMATNTRRLAEYLETPDLRQHVLESLPLKVVSKNEHQVMDGYQWILAVSAHTERHTKQILEVRADPNFPAN
jgi:DinB superfamily